MNWTLRFEDKDCQIAEEDKIQACSLQASDLNHSDSKYLKETRGKYQSKAKSGNIHIRQKKDNTAKPKKRSMPSPLIIEPKFNK